MSNVGLAFGLVICAGLSTCLGAAAVFCNGCVRAAHTRVLAAALALSGGVMMYVSFIEIFNKSLGSFAAAGVSGTTGSGLVYLYATLSFFGGIVAMALLHAASHALGGHAPAPEDPRALDPGELREMGLTTALAIAIHNFPEGLATYVATMADPAVGVTLAVAIGIHNIPEGLCVAMPMYYATNNRCRAFAWGALSGLTEPLGALVGYAMMGDAGSPGVYGVVFGMVGGMMVFIVVREILPTAHKYDRDDTVTSWCFFGGMVLMALSLVLFVVP